jgi:hypothetical protein
MGEAQGYVMVAVFALLDGKAIEASNSLEYASELRKQGKKYVCRNPACTDPELELCKGELIPPYFRHVKKCDCEKYGEPETFAHKAMKKWLVDLLGNRDTVQLEYYGIDGVRPDVLWQGKYAFEVQHSPIKTSEVERRNAEYERSGKVPIWIFHAEERKDAAYEKGKYRRRVERIHVFFPVERKLSHENAVPVFYVRFPKDKEAETFFFPSPLFEETINVVNPIHVVVSREELVERIADVRDRPEPSIAKLFEPEPEPEAIQPPRPAPVPRPRVPMPLPPLNDVHPIKSDYWRRNKIIYLLGDNNLRLLADVKKKRCVFIARPYYSRKEFRVTVPIVDTASFFLSLKDIVREMYDKTAGNIPIPFKETRTSRNLTENIFFLVYSSGQKITLGIKERDGAEPTYLRVFPLAFVGLANWFIFNVLNHVPIEDVRRTNCPSKPIGTPCPPVEARTGDCVTLCDFYQSDLEKARQTVKEDRAPFR